MEETTLVEEKTCQAPDFQVIDNVDRLGHPIKVAFSDYGPLHLNIQTEHDRPGQLHVKIDSDE